MIPAEVTPASGSLSVSRWDRAEAFVAWLAWGSIIVLLLWTARHGLDLGDESYYLVTAERPHDVISMTSAFGYLLHPVLQLVGGQIVGFRWLGVIILAAAAHLTGHAALRFARAAGFCPPASLPPIFGLSTMLYYTWVPLTPSYNWINLFGLLIAAAGLLRIATVWTQHPAAPLPVSALLVAATGSALSFLGKPTSGAIILTLGACWLVGYGRHRVWAALVYWGASSALIVTVATAATGGWNSLARQLLVGSKVTTMTGSTAHRPLSLPEVCIRATLRAASDIYQMALAEPLVFTGALAGITGTAAMAWAYRHRPDGRVASRLGAATVTLTWLSLLFEDRLIGGWPVLCAKAFWFGLLVHTAAAVATVVPSLPNGLAHLVKGRRSFLPVGLLFGWPIAFWLGSSNGLLEMMLMASGFCFLALCIGTAPRASMKSFSGSQVLWRLPLILVPLAILGRMPERMYVFAPVAGRPTYCSTSHMSQPITLAMGGTVRLAPDFARYIAKQTETAHQAGFAPGDPLINLSGINCGIQIALQARHLGAAWYIGGQEDLAAFTLELADPGLVRRSWILTADPIAPTHLAWQRPLSTAVLAKIGLDFPNAYTSAARVWNPVTEAHETLWKPTREAFLR